MWRFFKEQSTVTAISRNIRDPANERLKRLIIIPKNKLLSRNERPVKNLITAILLARAHDII